MHSLIHAHHHTHAQPHDSAVQRLTTGERPMQRATHQEIADQLLLEWHDWSNRYRISLGFPRCSPACREATSSKQWDSLSDLSNDSVYHAEMENVAWCVESLALDLQQAIGIEMRNRSAGYRVWRAHTPRTYAEALTAIMPVMRRRGLFD